MPGNAQWNPGSHEAVGGAWTNIEIWLSNCVSSTEQQKVWN